MQPAMSSLAIPATPPPTSPGPEVGAPPTAGGSRFNEALQQSQPATQAPGSGHATADKSNASGKGNPKASANAKDDGHTRNDASTLPGMSPAAVTVPQTVRPPTTDNGDKPPATGKTTTSAASPVGTTGIAVPLPALTPPALLPSPPAAPKAPSASVSSLSPTVIPPTLPAADAPTDNATAAIAQLLAEGSTAQASTDDKNANSVATTGIGDLGAHLAQLAGTNAAPAATPLPSPVQLSMQAAPGQPQFVQETAQHVAWLAGQDIQRAEIQLNPRRLGPIQVEITTRKDQVDVSFAVQHPQTVHALQQTLPQLHDMLAQQGLNLGNATVGQQAQGQRHAPPAYPAGGNTVDTEPTGQPVLQRLRIATPGRVDDFA